MSWVNIKGLGPYSIVLTSLRMVATLARSDLEQVKRFSTVKGYSSRELTAEISQLATFSGAREFNPLALKEIQLLQNSIPCIARIHLLHIGSLIYTFKILLDFFFWEKLLRGRWMEQRTSCVAIAVYRAVTDTHFIPPPLFILDFFHPWL